jgi:hypothetical protein
MSSILTQGGYLTTNQYLVSPNGCFFAIIQGDGNFCVYRGSGPANNGGALWCCASKARAAGDYFVAMQADGNLCVYPGTPAHPTGGAVWCIADKARPAATYGLYMQDDGNLCVYSGSPTQQSYVWGTQATDPVTDVTAITNVVYDLANAKVLSSAPEDLYSLKVPNSTSVQQTQTISQTVGVTETEGWSDTLGIKVGVKTNFKVGVPFIAEGKVEVSAEVSNTYTWNGSTTTTKTWAFNVNLVVPAKTTIQVLISSTISVITVPYALTGTVVYKSGATCVLTMPGVYKGSSSHDLTVTYNTPTGMPVQGTLTYQEQNGKTVQGLARFAAEPALQ